MDEDEVEIVGGSLYVGIHKFHRVKEIGQIQKWRFVDALIDKQKFGSR